MDIESIVKNLNEYKEINCRTYISRITNEKQIVLDWADNYNSFTVFIIPYTKLYRYYCKIDVPSSDKSGKVSRVDYDGKETKINLYRELRYKENIELYAKQIYTVLHSIVTGEDKSALSIQYMINNKINRALYPIDILFDKAIQDLKTKIPNCEIISDYPTYINSICDCIRQTTNYTFML